MAAFRGMRAVAFWGMVPAMARRGTMTGRVAKTMMNWSNVTIFVMNGRTITMGWGAVGMRSWGAISMRGRRIGMRGWSAISMSGRGTIRMRNWGAISLGIASISLGRPTMLVTMKVTIVAILRWRGTLLVPTPYAVQSNLR